jgi:nitrate reductase gamma subunit
LKISPDGPLLGKALFHLTYLVGWAGLALGLLGALALLVRRVFNSDYREYTKPADYFNLLFFIVTFVIAVAAHASEDPYFVQLRAHFQNLFTANFSFGGGPLLAVEVALASLLLAYIPLTHMSHFFTKWFMYHGIRWSDEPSFRGGEIEKRVGQALQYPVSWAAPHIRGDGKKNWVDVATSGVEED